MKIIISLLLSLVLLITVVSAAPFSVSAQAAFQEGDILYLKIENPDSWATGATIYVNFTDASRALNNNKSVVISTADKSLFDPSDNTEYDSSRGIYTHTVTADEAGSTVMRFWRGNTEKLWNESIVLTAANYAEGKNTVVVTDWTDTGYLTSTYDYNTTATLNISANTGEVGDSFDISVTNTYVPASRIDRAIYINDELKSSLSSYTFTPDADGAYTVKATVTAYNSTGRVIAYDTRSSVITVGSSPVTALTSDCLYAHAAVDGVSDSEAWVKWYNVNDTYYFFMPSSAKAYDTVELFSTLSSDISVNGTTVPSFGSAAVKVNADTSYKVDWKGSTRTVKFMFSTAEAALWVNNTDEFENYKDFFSYLTANKENSVAASGAVSTPDGKIENTEIKKMKGRGNTSWNADKKGFNVTFQNTIELAGMEKCKKFSLVSNFQDAAMARNRILFDLADEIGVPYSSDSRFIDLYTNGEYQGTYQICQKIDTGKNTLISDFEEDDYLDPETGGVKDDFCFVAEIDSSPAADDFHFTAKNGNNLTMKAPELATDDPNYNAVRTYIRSKYSVMYNNIGKANINDYIDINSLAKVYLINELGKNWDSGASSFYFTYKPDKDGKYKFFASPVWDYDNSLGNARGVSGDLSRLRITDYTLPSGWFSTKKNGYAGPNFLAEAVKNSVIMDEVRRVWFEDFLPALDILNSKNISDGELYSSNVYADILRGSADMNYKVWELVTNSSWICDHGSLRGYTADYTKNAYGQVTAVSLKQNSSTTTYDQYTFDGQFDYMMDWTNSRAAWISAQYIDAYIPSEPATEPTEAQTEEPTQPEEEIITPDLTDAIAAWIFDNAEKVSGDKLTEYGSSDEGYKATLGNGTMTLTVSGEKLRALEWSDAEYGKTGTLITPIMAAGSKNPWGEPYIRFAVPATGYDQLNLTLYLAGSNKCPAEWKLQHSTDGETFTDIDGASAKITAENRKVLTAYFDKTALPDFKYDVFHDTLILQLVPVSMTTVAGGSAADTPTGGELALNYAVIQGRTLSYDDVLMGDVDDSGEVDIIDVTYLQRYVIAMYGLTAHQLKAADFDRSGEADAVDATMLQRSVTGLR